MINVRLLGVARLPSGSRSALVYLTSLLHLVRLDLRDILTDYLQAIRRDGGSSHKIALAS